MLLEIPGFYAEAWKDNVICFLIQFSTFAAFIQPVKKHLLNSVFWSSLLIISCNSSEKPVFEKINSSEDGDFRGVFIRSSIDEVKKQEGVPPSNEESDYLYYEIPLGKNEEYYTLGYSFNEKGLYEILLDVYLDKPEDALQLFQDLKEKFTSRYGNPEQEDEATIVWTFTSGKSEEVELTLTDESASYNSGKLSVSFYDLAY